MGLYLVLPSFRELNGIFLGSWVFFLPGFTAFQGVLLGFCGVVPSFT